MTSAPPAVRLALIGGGHWGRNLIRTVDSLDAVDLVHLCSRNPENASKVPESCRISPDWGAVLDDPNVDGVMISTPPDTHFEIGMAALNNGLPVFMEKPLTMDGADARTLARESKKRGIPVIVDHIHLFNSVQPVIKEAVDRLGGLRAFQSCGGNDGPYRSYPPLWEWGPHDLSLVLDLVGMDVSILSSRCSVHETVDGHDAQVYEITLTSPQCASIKLTFGNRMKVKTRRMDLVCRDGSIHFDDVENQGIKISGNRQVQDMLHSPQTPVSPLENAIRHFIDAIHRPEAHLTEIDLGVRVVEMLQSIQDTCAYPD